MKKILIATAMTGALMSSTAYAAETDSSVVTFTADVLQECSIGDITAVAFPEVNINEGAGANALLLKNGSQSQTQNVYVSCNFPAKIVASSTNGGLKTSSPIGSDATDFTNEIDYRVELKASDSSFPTLDFRTNGVGSNTSTSTGAFHDNASLRVYIDRDDTAKRPVAGTYSDTTTINLGPI